MTSEEDDRRGIEEKDNRLREIGMAEDAIDRLMPHEKDYVLQTINQLNATFLGYWKSCTLPPCRRAKACKAYLTERQYREGGYDTGFPPCAGKDALRHAEMLQVSRMVQEAKEDARAQADASAKGRQAP